MCKFAKLCDKKDPLPTTLTESDAYTRYLQAFRTIPLKWYQGLCQEGTSSSSRLSTDQPATDLYIFWAEQWKGIFNDARFWVKSAISVIPLWLKDAFEHLISAVADKDIYSPTDEERRCNVLKFRRLILKACRLAAGIDPQAACNLANLSLEAVKKSGAERQTTMVAEWKALLDLFVSLKLLKSIHKGTLEKLNFTGDWIVSATRPIGAIICLVDSHHYILSLTDDLISALCHNDLILYLVYTLTRTLLFEQEKTKALELIWKG